MKKRVPLVVSLFLVLTAISAIVVAVEGNRRSNKERIEDLVKTKLDNSSVFHVHQQLSAFYKSHNYQLLWMKSNTPLLLMDSMISLLETSIGEGLQPENYHLQRIKLLRSHIKKHEKVNTNDLAIYAETELLLSDAFLHYGEDLYAGHISSREYNSDRKNRLATINMADSLYTAVTTNNLREVLQHLSCQYLPYKNLKTHLLKHIQLDATGGWPTFPENTQQKNLHSSLIRDLQKLLILTGDLDTNEIKQDSVYDQCMMNAVKKFQLRHQLTDDGKIGPLTLKQMNVPLKKRIMQLRINMERWRWLPHHVPQQYVLVNTSAFTLQAFEGKNCPVTMKVIVGMSSHRTPIFNADIAYLVLNPWWDVPVSIVKDEMIPEMQKDENYLTKNHLQVYNRTGDKTKPSVVNWKNLADSLSHYRLRQMPGPWNALGQIKFIFPNEYNVYLHDTPGKTLFSSKTRTFSHGCIRVEKPFELLGYLLANDTSWNEENISRPLSSGVEKIIVLKNPIAISIGYWTAALDEYNKIHINPDIYGYDQEHERLMDETETSIKSDILTNIIWKPDVYHSSTHHSMAYLQHH